MNVINKLDEFIAILERYFILVILMVMMTMASGQVILRNIGSTTIPGADVFARGLVVWITFLAASLTTHLNRHIVIDTLLTKLTPFLRCLTFLFTNSFAIIVCFIFFKTCITFVKTEMDSGTELIWGIHHYVVQSAFVYGFGMMFIRFSLKLLLGITDLIKNDFSRYEKMSIKAH